MKKLIALLLVATMLLPFTACAPGGPGSTEVPGVGDKKFIDALGERNYGGDTFTVSALDWVSYEVYGEEDSSDLLEAEVYKRNTAIEDRFNVRIEMDETQMIDHDSHVTYIKNAYNSAQETFDVAIVFAYKSGLLVTDEMLYDQRAYVPHVKDALEKGSAWWGKDVNDAFSVNGHQYVSVSDYCITAISMTYAMIFNSKIETDDNIAKNLGYTSMYDIVKKGKWTMDMLRQIVKDRYVDSTDAGVREQIDLMDTFGFLCDDATALDAFAPSLNVGYIENDGIHTPEMMSLDIRIESALSSVYELFHGPHKGAQYFTSPYAIDVVSAFAEDRAFIVGLPIYLLTQDSIHEMDSDFGIIPYPKAEGMTRYQSGTVDNHSVICVLAVHGEERLEFIGTMIEALSAETHNSVIDPYYDLIVTRNSTREEESIEMLDLIMEGRFYDLSTLHHPALIAETSVAAGDVCLGTLARYIVSSKVSDIASLWESVEIQFGRDIDDLIAIYNNMYSA